MARLINTNGQEEEIDDSIVELGKLARKVSVGKNRDAFLHLVAEENPDMRIPEVESSKRIAAATKPLQDKIAQLETERQQERALNDLAARRKPLADKGLTVADIQKVEQFMVDKGIASHEIAHQVMSANERAAAPTIPHDHTRPTLPSDDNGLYKDPARWRSNKLHGLIDDLKAGKSI